MSILYFCFLQHDTFFNTLRSPEQFVRQIIILQLFQVLLKIFSKQLVALRFIKTVEAQGSGRGNFKLE